MITFIHKTRIVQVEEPCELELQSIDFGMQLLIDGGDRMIEFDVHIPPLDFLKMHGEDFMMRILESDKNVNAINIQALVKFLMEGNHESHG